jgi:non-ribosomal peptide synthetase component F
VTTYQIDETVEDVVASRFHRKPLPNVQAYVLDQQLEPVPPGVVESCTSAGRMCPWLPARAELTAEKFIPDPFSRSAGARLYSTGDMLVISRMASWNFLVVRISR